MGEDPLPGPVSANAERAPAAAEEPIAVDPPADGVASPPAEQLPTPAALPDHPGTAPTTARVEIRADRPTVSLELRPAMDEGPWRIACTIPCGRAVEVDGQEARVAGPGISPSNPFQIAPGTGVLRLRVDTGTLRSRHQGIIALTTGLPLALVGLATYAIGKTEDAPAPKSIGIAAAAAGTTAILVAFPLLRAGSTRVRNDRRRRIATTSDRSEL
ncbi:MAG: hypothetical protein JW751_32285 [Polyangiaceae bacterium]|nr:hypothetical protein [Polyangiaceae bacterium]